MCILQFASKPYACVQVNQVLVQASGSQILRSHVRIVLIHVGCSPKLMSSSVHIQNNNQDRPLPALRPYALQSLLLTLFGGCPNSRVNYPVVRTLRVAPECPRGGNGYTKLGACLRTAWKNVYPSLRTIRVDPECPNSRVNYPALRAVR